MMFWPGYSKEHIICGWYMSGSLTAINVGQRRRARSHQPRPVCFNFGAAQQNALISLKHTNILSGPDATGMPDEIGFQGWVLYQQYQYMLACPLIHEEMLLAQ
jgi:hypothetical protein